MKKLICAFALILVTAFAVAQTAPSAIFYSDLTSAPNTGGQNNAGAFITIHGKGFGSAQGSSYVTVGGARVASYQAWSDSAITFQLGSAAKTGNIVVNVAGVASNSVPFTVRSGNIYFVSPNGSDLRSGSYSLPWKTVAHAVAIMQAGDIVYLENGYSQTTAQSNSAALILSRAGTSSAPMAIVAYPNSTATIGSSTSVTYGIGISGSNWVLAGLTLGGGQIAVVSNGVTGVRIAGSNMSCPAGHSRGGCVAIANSSSIALLGNQVHDSGLTSSTDLAGYDSILLLGTNMAEVGWNQILNTSGCNAISVDPNGSALYGFNIHDNLIQNTRCEAISLSDVAPSQGAVNVYNNIIVHSGTGPVPGGTATSIGYAAVGIGGSSSTPVQVYNNTIYDAGAMGGPDAAAFRAQAAANFRNNIVYLASGEQYVSSDSNVSVVTGTNNLFYGAGNPLGIFASSIVADPQFVSASNGNFHLQASSPAIDSGASVQLATDFDGVLRPQGSAYDIGAYESTVSTPVTGTLSVSPSTLSFGTVTTGQSTTSSTVLTNTGKGSVTLSGANSTNTAFQASGISFPLTLAAGQSTTLTATFAPTSAGSQTGTIAVNSNATNTPTNISVSGTGQAATAAVSLSSSSVTFASQALNTTSATQTVTVSNTGTASLSITSVTATGDFSQTNNCGTSLAAGSSCSVSIKFTPTAAGTRTGTLSIADNATGSPQTISLSGTGAGLPAVSLSPASLTFASQTVGTTSVAQNVTVSNTGTASLTISSIALSGSDFAITNGCGSTLAAGASCNIAVTFKPTAAGTRTGTITFANNASSGTQQIALSGTGVAATGTLSASASSLAFSNTTVGTTTSESLTITNTGSASVTISAISTGNAAFTVSGVTLPAIVAAGGSVTLNVAFAPSTATSYSSTMTISSNATNSTLSAALSGTGTPVATPHQVTVNWSESASVAGFNVYRSTVSGSGYTKMNGTLISSTSYVDTAVTAGATYYYVVTAVDGNGVESAYSTQASATVPTP